MTPLLTDEQVLSIEAAEPKRLNATEAGRRLALTREERANGKIRTIRAVGQTDETMKEERRERDAAADRAKRAAKPKKMKLKDARPWEAEGISERTWRWRNAKERCRKNVGNKYTPNTADEKTATPKRGARPGRAAKRTSVSEAELNSKLRHIGKIAAEISQRTAEAAIALGRALKENQGINPVSKKKNDRRAA